MHFLYLHSRFLAASKHLLVLACLFLGSVPLAAEPVAPAPQANQLQRLQQASADMQLGARQITEGQYAEAVSTFNTALRTLPDIPQATPLRDYGVKALADASVAQAKVLAAEGRYREAEELLQNVLSPSVAPDHKEALKFLSRMRDPDRYPVALTPQHVANTKEVLTLLQKADSFYELADFDSARETYLQVLRIDNYNQAARRGMERAEQQRARYYNAARDHRKARMLTEVDSLWEDAIPPSTMDLQRYSETTAASLQPGNARDSMLKRLREIIVPRVEFSGAAFDEIIEFLRLRSKDLDPTGKGVDFIINIPQELATTRIDLNLTQVPLEEIVRYVAQKAGATFKIDEFAVRFVSLSDVSTDLINRTFRVPPGFIESTATESAAADNPFGQPAGNASFNGLTLKRISAREFLESRGVTFPEGASASYSTATNRLVVRNNAANMDIVELLVEQAANSSPKQAVISIRMIEVNQNNMEEFGFDWLMGQFSVPGSNSVFGSGGTSGNMQPPDAPSQNFPMLTPNTDLAVGLNPMTAGLRSSGEILGRPNIDGLLGENTATQFVNSRSPGQFAVGGVLTDPQFQVVLRAINQKKGIDIMAMPSIVAKSGQKATIDLAREFIYPTEFDPPEIPQQVGSVQIGNLRIQGAGNNSAPITPSTPTTFEMRKVGVVIEMEPVINDNGKDVEILLTPELTEFEGFIDYGSDINNTVDTGNGPVSQPVDNRIIQPVFRTNRISTAVRIFDGSTVVLGGALQQRSTRVQDKVPVLGSIPLLGRLWKSQVDYTEKKNFLVFVTVQIIDPSGQPINQLSAAPAQTTLPGGQ
jgi:general secretion pathway protein D